MGTPNDPLEEQSPDRALPALYQVRPRKIDIMAGIAAEEGISMYVIAGLMLKDGAAT